MKPCLAVTLPIVVGFLGVLGVRPAFAGEEPNRGCAPMVVAADGDVLDLWPDLPERVRGAFDGREDIDVCARVRLTMLGSAITVEVILPDGRSASRSVPRREDVVPMLEALLLVPQRATPTPVVEPPIAPLASIPDIRVTASATTSERDARKRLPEASRNRLRIELSVLAGTRMGDGQVGLGLGAVSLLETAGWLVGFGGRADQYGIDGGASGGAFELAAMGGRRFRFGNLALDLTGGPALALQGSSVDKAQPTGERMEYTSGSLPRLVVGTRLNFSARSVVRTFLGAELSAGSTSGPNPPSEIHRLPLWTVGLALGGTVGTL